MSIFIRLIEIYGRSAELNIESKGSRPSFRPRRASCSLSLQLGEKKNSAFSVGTDAGPPFVQRVAPIPADKSFQDYLGSGIMPYLRIIDWPSSEKV
jgi:hypothetical protein